ncbi:hypothetical protein [Nostoc sp.]|uniref:hypothetical protein n=1 Tax=Nostoc sp. TaxID=1180 RepID=UPI002FF567AA
MTLAMRREFQFPADKRFRVKLTPMKGGLRLRYYVVVKDEQRSPQCISCSPSNETPVLLKQQ